LQEASKPLFLESESESDHVERELDDESEDNLKLGEDKKDVGNKSLKVEDFVLVALAGKKSTKCFFASKVFKEHIVKLYVLFLKCVELSKFVLTQPKKNRAS
jgi:hypothetical protein